MENEEPILLNKGLQTCLNGYLLNKCPKQCSNIVHAHSLSAYAN